MKATLTHPLLMNFLMEITTDLLRPAIRLNLSEIEFISLNKGHCFIQGQKRKGFMFHLPTEVKKHL